MDTIALVLLVIGLPIVFIAMWLGVCRLTAYLSGWSNLAAHYRYERPFKGTVWGMQSARIGWANYGGVLSVGADRGGLYIKALVPFRPGHPALYIPWSDIATTTRRFIFSYHVFHIAKVPGTAIRVHSRLGRRIAEVVGGLPGLDDG